jgi:hypothetical protein
MNSDLLLRPRSAGIDSNPWSAQPLEPFNTLGFALSGFIGGVVDGRMKSIARHRRDNSVAEGPQKILEGHSFELDDERRLYISLARLPEVRTICEIGFNAGHSAALWLLANPKAMVIMFDLWEHTDYSPRGELFLRYHSAGYGVVAGDERLVIVKGPSQTTVPMFTDHSQLPEAQRRELLRNMSLPSSWGIKDDGALRDPSTKALERLPRRCDLLSIDGDHSFDGCERDLENFARLANPKFHIAVVDDSNTDDGPTDVQRQLAALKRLKMRSGCPFLGSSNTIDAVLMKQERAGKIKTLKRIAEVYILGMHMRGVTMFQYNTTSMAGVD